MNKKSILTVEEENPLIYCRRCMEHKRNSEFYSAVDQFLDTRVIS